MTSESDSDQYFICPRRPGKLKLSFTACASDWKRACDPNAPLSLSYCKGCPIGAKHAGRPSKEIDKLRAAEESDRRRSAAHSKAIARSNIDPWIPGAPESLRNRYKLFEESGWTEDSPSPHFRQLGELICIKSPYAKELEVAWPLLTRAAASSKLQDSWALNLHDLIMRGQDFYSNPRKWDLMTGSKKKAMVAQVEEAAMTLARHLPELPLPHTPATIEWLRKLRDWLSDELEREPPIKQPKRSRAKRNIVVRMLRRHLEFQFPNAVAEDGFLASVMPPLINTYHFQKAPFRWEDLRKI